ncbi:hypothetical protein BD779DRAFT_912789 [Infundibulicybe gibba]|nr:hypothetical protein BD779DRAFT_912789 [Infundibulicybe gibba]
MCLSPDAFRALAFPPTGNNIFPRLARLIVRDVTVPDQELIDVCRFRLSPSLNGIEGGPQAEPLNIVKYTLLANRTLSSGSRTWQSLSRIIHTFEIPCTRWRYFCHQILLEPRHGSHPRSHWKISIILKVASILSKSTRSIMLYCLRHDFENIMSRISMESSGSNAVPPHLQMRASALLAKWRPLMEEYNSRDTRWILKWDSDDSCRLVCCPGAGGRFVSHFLWSEERERGF